MAHGGPYHCTIAFDAGVGTRLELEHDFTGVRSCVETMWAAVLRCFASPSLRLSCGKKERLRAKRDLGGPIRQQQCPGGVLPNGCCRVQEFVPFCFFCGYVDTEFTYSQGLDIYKIILVAAPSLGEEGLSLDPPGDTEPCPCYASFACVPSYHLGVSASRRLGVRS